MLRPLAWQPFQQMPMARWACSLMLLVEPQQAGAGICRRHTRRRALLAGSTKMNETVIG
jgi:hypothetical protein